MRIYRVEFEVYDKENGWTGNYLSRDVAAIDMAAAIKEAEKLQRKYGEKITARASQVKLLAESEN